MIYQILLISVALSSTYCTLSGQLEPESRNGTDLNPDEASEVAQSFLDAGLGGMSLLRMKHSDNDIDSCRLIRTTIYEVELHSTGEIFEITAEKNATNAQNCWNKDKLINLIAGHKILQALRLTRGIHGQPILEQLSVDQFLVDMTTIERENFRILESKYSYRFGEEDDPDNDIEIIEFHIQMMDTGEEFLVNTEAAMGFHGPLPITPKRKPLPSKLLLSLLGGGNYSKMKKLR